MKHYSTKHYGHNIGLSAVFRQPKADHSHCHLLHGYSLAFTFTFGCDELDNKNWVVDFGGLKPLKAWLEDQFDHKHAFNFADKYIREKTNNRCYVVRVECAEHGANSAIYEA
jgi:6-pyruvoyltetrahydropterin/6-carboxytetrahydropterin synthase